MEIEGKMACGSVRNWLSRLSPSTAKVYRFHFRKWLIWMEENGGQFSELNPDELLTYQKAADNGELYKILDFVQMYVLGMEGDYRYNYKLKPLIVVRSFFTHNRAVMPQDVGFIVNGDKPPVEGTLSVDEIKMIILGINELHQAVFLSMLQGGMGISEVLEWNRTGLVNLRSDLAEVSLLPRHKRVISIKLPGRKKMRNRRPYYTYVGPDAIDALGKMLKNRKAKESEYIFVNNLGNPISEHGLRAYWNRHLRRLGLIEHPLNGDTGNRYGKNPHEMRDVFRSQWEKSSAKGTVAEFMMGHTIDALGYNKACKDTDWTLEEYNKALPLLQIMSSGTPFGRVEKHEADRQRDRISELESELEKVRAGSGEALDLRIQRAVQLAMQVEQKTRWDELKKPSN